MLQRFRKYLLVPSNNRWVIFDRYFKFTPFIIQLEIFNFKTSIGRERNDGFLNFRILYPATDHFIFYFWIVLEKNQKTIPKYQRFTLQVCNISLSSFCVNSYLFFSLPLLSSTTLRMTVFLSVVSHRSWPAPAFRI